MNGSPSFAWTTPPAPAAIAVVCCRGAPGCLAALFDRPLPASGHARVARLRGPDGAAIDEAVVVRLADDVLEAMVHGGPGVRAAVDQALGAHGFSRAAPTDDGVWTALAAAASPAALRWLLAAAGDPPPFPAEYLRRAPVVLITGPANAGKSTLLNAWCGRQRALVSDVPGTTRDLVAAETLIRGWRLRLIDSAGLRGTDDPLELAGQELVARARAWADVVIYLDPPDGAGPGPCAGDLLVRGKADLRTSAVAEPTWSAFGAGGSSTETLLAGLGDALLARLGLPG